MMEPGVKAVAYMEPVAKKLPLAKSGLPAKKMPKPVVVPPPPYEPPPEPPPATTK
jgi:hypothetical protein